MKKNKVCQSQYKDYYISLRNKGLSIPDIYRESKILRDNNFSIQSMYRFFQELRGEQTKVPIPNEVVEDLFISIFRYCFLPSCSVLHNPYRMISLREDKNICMKLIKSANSHIIDKPIYESKKEVYTMFKEVANELECMDILKGEWSKIWNEPIHKQPYFGKSLNEYFEK